MALPRLFQLYIDPSNNHSALFSQTIPSVLTPMKTSQIDGSESDEERHDGFAFDERHLVFVRISGVVHGRTASHSSEQIHRRLGSASKSQLQHALHLLMHVWHRERATRK